jgi:phage/plasmid-associated DNA primase
VIRKPDEACWERVRVIPFESKFLPEHKCPPTIEEQYEQKIVPRDPDFSKRIDSILQPFAWFLIYHLRCLNKKNRIVPDKVRVATNMYKEENNNDPTQEFKDDEIEKDPRGELSVDEVCTRYRDWWKVNYAGEKLISTKKVIVNSFTKILGDVYETMTKGGMKKKVYRGFSWRKCSDEDEEVPRQKLNRINPML